MCIYLTIEGTLRLPVGLKGLVFPLQVSCEKKEAGWFSTAKKAAAEKQVIRISEDGCACSMMTDEADSCKPAWDFRAEVLEPLAETIRLVSAGIDGEFTFEAHWVGDKVKNEPRVTLDALVEAVRANQIAPYTRYYVQR